MEYTVIRNKNKYHGRCAIKARVNVEGGEFYYIQNNQIHAKTVSFEYVAFKAGALGEWLRARDIAAPVVYSSMYGKLAGLAAMFQCIEGVELHHMRTGEQCDAMLSPRLIDFEGFAVRVMIKDKPYEGLLERRGEAILGHFVTAAERSKARYLKPYEVMGVELI